MAEENENKPIRYDSGFFSMLSEIGDMLLLNVFFLLGCLPVVTIGVSVSAVYYVCFQRKTGNGESIWSLYKRGYRQDLKQGIVLFLITAAAAVFIYLDVQAVTMPGTDIGTFWLVAVAVLALVFAAGTAMIWPLLCRYSNTVGKTLKNSFLLGLGAPLRSLLISFLWICPVLLMLYFPFLTLAAAVIWMVIGFALIGRITGSLAFSILREQEKENDSL